MTTEDNPVEMYRVGCPACGYGWTEPRTEPARRECPECGENWRA